MHGSAKPMRELQNLLPRADHTELYLLTAEVVFHPSFLFLLPMALKCA
jgi:hypothetical protein